MREETDQPAGGNEERGPKADSGGAAYDAAAQSTPQEPTPTGAEAYADAAHGGAEDRGGGRTSESEATSDSE